ncbi:dNDP-4-keto-6-deoxy-glucose-2,3- dehydratase [bacterium 1XD42-1]|nr:dNDP-4-keto-6-deoxy-glucose-2,3- dehydratase [bacterium 1XD42-8]RKJ62906.1 dNDP-4-keto-6-deoxy-glucose-2,3- dehydratase [bacterium 1XD42-1]
MNNTLGAIARSWCILDSKINSINEILDWVRERNKTIQVEIHKVTLEQCAPWFYDRSEGCIRNQNHSFFTITGYQQTMPDGTMISQPVILQEEIGYLGIICQEINGVMYFLMQAKIEPGNVNKIQISPTIQATKSNFTQIHGGHKPPYLEYFLNASEHEIVVDQIQSEQSSRFYKKRNRNIIICVEKEILVLPSHRWMTLGQIKRLMQEDNLVNMDTRTVLSCIPYSKLHLSRIELLTLADHFSNKPLFCSTFEGTEDNILPQVYQTVNNQKMFNDTQRQLVPLHALKDWGMVNGEFICKSPYSFKVIFCDIAIEGREVRHWTQPLFEATGVAVFGLICCEDNGILKFLVKSMSEIGCFDGVELGPTIQQEAVAIGGQEKNTIDSFFWERLNSGEGVIFDHYLSEEGGRFYHEQNRNVLLWVDRNKLPELPKGYFLLDYRTLNELVQVNNTLNIQLRNLLSLLEA